jgi:hypothetical protein
MDIVRKMAKVPTDKNDVPRIPIVVMHCSSV